MFQDLIFLVVSISFAVFVTKTGITHQLVASFGDLNWFGVIIAGSFFTSVFTIVPSIAVISAFAETTPLPTLALLGGLGAVVGDYIIFRLVKDRMSADVDYLISFSGARRYLAIFRTHLFKFLVPFLGALVIASPLPNELGITMMGLAKVKDRSFLVISFIFNSLGILIIGWLAKSII